MRRLSLLLVPLVLLACERQPVAPDIAPTLNIANAPALTGIVVRADYPLGYLDRDPKTGLGMALGVDAYDVCTPGPNNYYMMPWADKELVDRIVANAQGTEVPTQIWYVPEAPWTCAMVLASEPIATGVSKVFGVLTGLFGADAQNTRQAIWGAHGLLDNGVFHFKAHVHEKHGLMELSVTLK